MSETIDDVLEGLAAARQTMDSQVDKMNEIIDKSNSTLLNIESLSNLPTTTPATTTAVAQNIFNVSAECEQSVVQLLVQFRSLMQRPKAEQGGKSALNSCMASRQCVEYLGSNVRKLVALCDMIAQLKQNIAEQQCTEDEDEDLYSE